MAPFRHMLHDHDLWSIRRRTVVPALALGVFIAFIPVPGHILIAALVALLLRINIAIAVVSTQVVNPLTVGPLYYSCYKVGVVLLGTNAEPFIFKLSLASISSQFDSIWQPLLLGCLLVGAFASMAAYVGLNLIWRASIADYIEKRRRRKSGQADSD